MANVVRGLECCCVTFALNASLERNRLKGTLGNAVNALLSAAAMNFGKLLKWVGQFWLFFSNLLRMISPVVAPLGAV